MGKVMKIFKILGEKQKAFVARRTNQTKIASVLRKQISHNQITPQQPTQWPEPSKLHVSPLVAKLPESSSPPRLPESQHPPPAV
jgi:hypothetical protein